MRTAVNWLLQKSLSDIQNGNFVVFITEDIVNKNNLNIHVQWLNTKHKWKRRN